MKPIQVAIMCSTGRPRLQATCLERLANEGGLFTDGALARAPRVYLAGEPSIGAAWIRSVFDVVELAPGRPHLPSFWRVFEDAAGGVPLLFLENDVWIVRDGIPRVAELADELPADAGLVTLFDFRNESNGQRWQQLDSARAFWGTQAVLFSPAAVEALGQLAREKRAFDSFDSWDVWSGLAVAHAKLGLYLHAPSLVQHLGARSEVWPERPWVPRATNFPESIPEPLDVDG